MEGLFNSSIMTLPKVHRSSWIVYVSPTTHDTATYIAHLTNGHVTEGVVKRKVEDGSSDQGNGDVIQSPAQQHHVAKAKHKINLSYASTSNEVMHAVNIIAFGAAGFIDAHDHLA